MISTRITRPQIISLLLSLHCLATVVSEPPPEPPDDDYFDENGALFPSDEVDSSIIPLSPQVPRFRRSTERDQACEMLVAIDEPLYKHLGSNLENATQLARDMVRRVNDIYHRTLLRGEFSRLYFRLKEIRVLFDFCTECNQTQQIYLKEFSNMKFADFCLAHVFTYRDFPLGVQGLAWKGTLCHKTFNTGFTTLLNHQMSASHADSAMTFAHEVGHNFGAEHDEDAGCEGDYIMSSSGTSHKNPVFSPCSMRNMSQVLRKVLANGYPFNCFKAKPISDPEDFSVCGDGIVSGEEECDCGLHYESCYDECCYAAHISDADLEANSSAIPCRRHSQAICLRPYKSMITWGFIAPWIFILTMAVISVVGLVWDWRNKKIFYTHVTHPDSMIRSETGDQMSRRIERHQNQGKVYVIQSPNGNVPAVGSRPVPPPRPEKPKAGIVKQLRSQLERKI